MLPLVGEIVLLREKVAKVAEHFYVLLVRGVARGGGQRGQFPPPAK